MKAERRYGVLFGTPPAWQRLGDLQVADQSLGLGGLIDIGELADISVRVRHNTFLQLQTADSGRD
jgi:hypothetical protein